MWRVVGVVASVQHAVLSNQQLHFLSDVPHMLKNVCNCLLSYDIVLPPDVVVKGQLCQFLM